MISLAEMLSKCLNIHEKEVDIFCQNLKFTHIVGHRVIRWKTLGTHFTRPANLV